MQLTIPNIPEEVDEALRARAAAEGKTVEQLALEALVGAVSAKPTKKRDLSDIAETWVEDPEFDRIRQEQDQIEPEMWK